MPQSFPANAGVHVASSYRYRTELLECEAWAASRHVTDEEDSATVEVEKLQAIASVLLLPSITRRLGEHSMLVQQLLRACVL